VGIPVAFVIIGGLVLLIAVLVVAVVRKGKKHDDWEIRYDELEVGEHLGTGGFGEVYRATWKGTEVAVKVMASDRISKEMEKSFKDEVRVMTSLRHPNVVLFMAASTKAPKMCIVMEFMSLGSLFDVRRPTHSRSVIMAVTSMRTLTHVA
jgi:serine/threonine protein kinase